MIRLKKKLFKDPDIVTLFTIDFTEILDSLTLDTIVSVTPTSNSLVVDSASINAVAIEVEGDAIEAGKAVQVQFSDGDDNNEYRVVLIFTKSDASEVEVTFIVVVTNLDIDYYGAAYYGDDYFAMRLRSDAWTEASVRDKVKAMVAATLAIDQLYYRGDLSDPDQVLQFPRGTDADVPDAIIRACYEEALSLLDEADPEIEQANLSAISQGISSVRTTYDRSFVHPNLRAGITSFAAWKLLAPYLRDPNEIVLSRV